MLSNTLELAGLSALVAGSYELAGRGWALLVLAGCLLFLGVAADGLHPVQLVRVASSDLRGRLGAWWRKRFRAAPHPNA